MLNVQHSHTVQDGVLVVHVEIHQSAPSDDNPADRRAQLAASRKNADKVAQVMGEVARTSGRAAGALPAMSGASHYEFAGAPG